MDGHDIRYDVVDCSLGRLLVAGTCRGVCIVRFGEGVEALESAMRAEFPFAEPKRDPGAAAPWVAALLGYLSGRSQELELPLDVRGSRFQRRVWDAIAAIPYGETRTYGELAGVVGKPRAARAVARACGANPVALAVPCHRVVGARGDGGYRWGVGRKRALLDLEKESDLSLSFSGLGSPDAGEGARDHETPAAAAGA